MSYRFLLNKTCTIARASASKDARGIVTPTWTDVATDVRCALVPLSSRDDMYLSGFGIKADFRLFFLRGTDVRPDPRESGQGGTPDRVTISSAAYLVRHVGDPSGRERMLVAYVARDI